MVNHMKRVNLADTKAHLSELVAAAAAAGETVCIMRRGKPAAMLVSAARERGPIDPALLRRVTDPMPLQSKSAGDFIRRLRDEERF